MAKNFYSILEDYFANKLLTEEEQGKVNDYMLKCMLIAQKPNITKPFTNYSKNLEHILKLADCFMDIEDLLHKQFSNQRFIELGPGAQPLANWALQYGISEYIGVEPFNPEITENALPKNPKVKLEKEKEALEFLLGQENESAIVMSMGVLCAELFNFNDDNYFRFIVKEIYRVTPKGGFTINSIHSIAGIDYFTEAGFRSTKDTPARDFISQSTTIYVK